MLRKVQLVNISMYPTEINIWHLKYSPEKSNVIQLLKEENNQSLTRGISALGNP